LGRAGGPGGFCRVEIVTEDWCEVDQSVKVAKAYCGQHEVGFYKRYGYIREGAQERFIFFQFVKKGVKCSVFRSGDLSEFVSFL